MISNKTLLIATLLITISFIPQSLSLFHLINNGGLDWPMQWSNEATAWSAIFYLLAVLGLFVTIANRKKTPKISILLALFASIIILSSAYALVSSGIGPSSKGDDKKLHLIAFWSSGWWK